MCEVPGQTAPAPGSGERPQPRPLLDSGPAALTLLCGDVWARPCPSQASRWGRSSPRSRPRVERGRVVPPAGTWTPAPVTGHQLHGGSLGTEGSALRPSQPEGPLLGDGQGPSDQGHSHLRTHVLPRPTAGGPPRSGEGDTEAWRGAGEAPCDPVALPGRRSRCPGAAGAARPPGAAGHRPRPRRPQRHLAARLI